MRKTLLFAAWTALTALAQAPERYPLGPDSQVKPGVPQGTITKYEWSASKIYPGTTRDYWTYVPAQYDAAKPAAVMIFQDGGGMIARDGRWRVPVVLDNLIASGEMPVTVGIFINPGVMPAAHPNAEARYNRSFEYDALGDRYARFLIEEILPEVGKKLNLTTDPNLRGLMGSSSGAIAAFNAAWERPDQFRRVLSTIGTFVNIRGGQDFPTRIRKFEPRPLRVFLQDGRNDNNIYAGSWWVANQDMAAAFEWAGYEYTFVAGEEKHNNIHGSSILPDALRWLWKDPAKPIGNRLRPGDRQFSRMIAGDSQWEKVSEGHQFTEGPAVDRDGNLYFSDVRASKIFRIIDGKVSLFKDDTANTNGLMFGPDGKLYACENGRRRIVAYDVQTGVATPVATDVTSNDLVINAKGEIWFTDPTAKKVWYLPPGGEKRVVHEGLEFPNGIMLSPDQTLLTVADSRSKWVWSFQIGPDGGLLNGQPFYRLETNDQSSATSADGMTMDTEGYLWVTTNIGLQICDQPGRVTAILNKPQPGSLSNVVFAGKELDTIYVTAGDKVFRRKVNRKGLTPWSPVKPPRPGL